MLDVIPSLNQMIIIISDIIQNKDTGNIFNINFEKFSLVILFIIIWGHLKSYFSYDCVVLSMSQMKWYFKYITRLEMLSFTDKANYPQIILSDWFILRLDNIFDRFHWTQSISIHIIWRNSARAAIFCCRRPFNSCKQLILKK